VKHSVEDTKAIQAGMDLALDLALSRFECQGLNKDARLLE